LIFRDELIKIKSFNPISKVDITREERLAKYDKLIDEFLNIFKLERLKKLAENKGGEKDEIYRIANELYKNL
jgi:katanin p80 WD40 repeat-containing subunit B1